ncbi:16S rRNA (cytosine(967)-C(5))-methyltransferase RsmB [Salipaludibacillus agaradhaerens]|uniref:16S rRNA (cytosine(967)-C(5))-methyltransferase n=1 Tax=Salipaludibacillus agaradhaerens TaxID=76935 RepID=A0A9Q4FY45_SALAG|nr:16S rRNA (cytosine(967)-C(5))-methyltransferase RsmB [Salipaludibacillus agaradhaerens]MCR6095986.1 16S rRNA (cytosine(967)-C(5))-methyltransferase RsmB [Salipaludibacillus agaradhaerens]MCR6114455.1 16S rRNA (cytosine(967)-C(5))-methyltransferase RsmB [Salipaludibacillus agaradhaerens]
MTNQKKRGNVREAAVDILLKIEKNQAYSNLLINDTIKKMTVPAIDVPLLTELVYGTVQYQKRLDFYLQAFSKKPLVKLDKWVLVLLRMTVYQLVFLDRIPDHAAINEAVEIAKSRGHKGISGMVNGILRSMLRGDLPDYDLIDDEVERMAVETSHPEWLLKRWIEQYGKDKARQIATANLATPVQSVRVNKVRISKQEVIALLKEDGLEIEESELIPESLRITRGSVVKTSAFKQGLVTIQDEGSMLVAKILAPNPTERVLDACAAPGGKSTHLAELMNDTGDIISVDIHAHKVKLIEQQKDRLQLKAIQGMVSDARELKESFPNEQFDKILVDAPCSGLGVIQRKPDLKWSKQSADVNRLAMIQDEILEKVWPLLKKNGRLVYSTCTIDQEENEDVVESFVKRHHDAEFDDTFSERLPELIRDHKEPLTGMVQLFPGEFGTDGFFISSLIKK